jgi:hypothetical protein
MSDRHAWAEVFFEGLGWVPVDTQPEQVESHANTDMDMGLLEELMDLLGPDEELLPDSLVEDEAGVKQERNIPLPSLPWLLVPACLALFTLYAAKYWLRKSFRFTQDDALRAERLYRALISHYMDIGYSREQGETLKEFQIRLSHAVHSRVLSLTPRILESKYANAIKQPLSQAAAEEVYRGEMRERKNLSLSKKILCALSLRSVFQLCLGRNW